MLQRNKALPFVYRNEVDRFGFSYLVAKSTAQERVPLCRCSWIHGWKWYPINDFRQLSPSIPPLIHKTIVVTNEVQQDFLISSGFRRVILGGLPFCYALTLYEEAIEAVNDEIIEKDRDVLLIPPKSQSYLGIRRSFFEFIDYVMDSFDLRERSVICVFKSDLERADVYSKLIRSGLPYVTGADPYDPLSLVRTVCLFKRFKRLLTNTIGSHIPYGASLGLDVQLAGPFDNRSESDFAQDPAMRAFGSDFIEYMSYVHSKSFFIEQFSGILNSDLVISSRTWGEHEIGRRFELPICSLPSIFGWTTSGFLRALAEGVRHRCWMLRSRLGYSSLNSSRQS